MLKMVPKVSVTLAASVHDEHCRHRWCDEAEHRLEYVEEIHALYVVNSHGDDYRHQCTYDGYYASCAHYFLLRGLRTDVLHVDVHREHRAQGVERRAYGADERGGENGKHEANHAHGEEARHESHVGVVGLNGHISEETGLPEGEAHDAGDDVYGHVEYLQPARKVGSLLSFAEVFGCQYGLNHRLVGAPEPQSAYGIAQQNGQPGEVFVAVGLKEVPVIRRHNVGIGQHGDASCERVAAETVYSYEGQRGRNEYEQHHLIYVGVGHGLQSAEHCEEGGDAEQQECRHPHGYAEHLAYDYAAREERQREPRDEYRDDGIPRQHVACGLSEAQAHKLGQGGNLAAEIARGEDEGQQGYEDEGVPCVVARHDARGEAGACRRYEHGGAYVGAPHGESYVVPAQRMFGKKQAAALLALGACPYTDGKQDDEVCYKYAPVEAM